MKETELLRLIEGYIEECTNLECECECSGDEDIEVSDEGYEEPVVKDEEIESFVPYMRVTPSTSMEEDLSSSQELDEENPCEQGASYNMSRHGCFDNIKGTKARFKPGYRPDAKKGFVKVSDTKTVAPGVSETEHWHGQGMTAAHA
jgi:hypothetical protein